MNTANSKINRSRCILKCKPGGGLGNHRFPHNDKNMMKLWIEAIGGEEKLPNIRSPYLCSRHFEPQYLSFVKGKYHLIRPAVPTLFGVNINKMNTQIKQDKQKNKIKPKSHQFLPNKTCRACFTTKSDNLQSIFDSPKLLEIFKRCSYLKVEQNDGLPTKLCTSCVIKCFSWYNFNRLCRQTDTFLRSVNKNKDPLGGGCGGGGKKQIPINNTNENSFPMSEDDEDGNYIIYKDETPCDSDDNENSHLKIDNLNEVDVKLEIEELICLPTIPAIGMQEEEEADNNENRINIDDVPCKLISCDKCSEKCMNKIMFKIHMEKFHTKNNHHDKMKPYKCNICNERFMKIKNFFDHQQNSDCKGKSLTVVKTRLAPIQPKPIPVQIFANPVGTSSDSIETAVKISSDSVKTFKAPVELSSTVPDQIFAMSIDKSEGL